MLALRNFGFSLRLAYSVEKAYDFKQFIFIGIFASFLGNNSTTNRNNLHRTEAINLLASSQGRVHNFRCAAGAPKKAC